jgi:hypothetical protein
MGTVVALTAIIVVLSICLLFVFHPEYHTGALGTAGLSLMGVGALMRFSHLIDSHRLVSNVEVLVWFGLALWLMQSLYNFLRRCSRKDSTWYRGNKQQRAEEQRA